MTYHATTPKVDEMQIRRAILRLTIGSQIQIDTPVGQERAAADCALAFGRAKKISVMVMQEHGCIVIHRNAPEGRPSIRPELDALKVGESHVFPFPPIWHDRVRSAAAARNRSGEVLFTCRREGDQIRVTRLPMTPEEFAAAPDAPQPVGDTGKYRLRRLLTPGARVTYNLPREQHFALRNSVSRFAMLHNLRLRCRLQDDGSMLVYRVDAAEEPGQAAQ